MNKLINFFNSDVRIESFYNFCLVCFAFVLTVGFVVVGEGCHFNFKTYFLGIAQCAILFFGVRFLRNSILVKGIGLALGFHCIMYFLIRILGYLAFEPSHKKLMYILFPMKWTSAEINAGMIYLNYAMAATFIGLFISQYLFKIKNFDPKNLLVNVELENWTWPALLSLIITVVVQSYYFIYLGVSASTNCTNIDVPNKWIIHFFSSDIACIGVLALLSINYLSSKNKKYLFIFGIVSFLFWIFTLELGSRGGILRICLFIFFIFLSYSEKYRVKIKYVAFMMLGFVGLSVLSFKLGTSIRVSRYNECNNIKVEKSSPVKQVPFLSEVSKESNLIEKKVLTESKKHLKGISCEMVQSQGRYIPIPNFLQKIFDRLGLIDYPLGLVAHKQRDELKQEYYFSYAYMFKSFINNIVPGSPFPEVEFMSSNTIPLVYRGEDLQYIKDNFMSEVLTIWGASYLYNSYWGGVFSCFLLAVFSVFTVFCLNVFPKNLRAVMVPVWLWMGVLGLFFMNSYDYWLTLCVFFLIELFSFSCMTFSFRFILSKLKSD